MPRRSSDELFARQELSLVVTYGSGPGGGLCNQLAAIINSFSVAFAAQAAVQLQPSVYRNSYNLSASDMTWSSIDIGSVLDVPAMRGFWFSRGVAVHDYVHEIINVNQVVEMRTHEMPAGSLSSLVNKVYAAAFTAIAEMSDEKGAGRPEVNLTIDLGYTMERIRISPHAKLFELVIKSVAFAPSLNTIAEQISAKLFESFPIVHGVHLRIEHDYVHHPALDHQGTCDDTLHCLQHQFIPALQQANLNRQAPIYVASGIFSANQEHVPEILNALSPFGSRILHKEMLADTWLLETLNSEQLAAIDFMILRKTSVFVGVLDSSFSKMVARFRTVDGFEPATNIYARTFDSARLDLS